MGNDFKMPTPEERRKLVHDYAYGKTNKVDIEEARLDNAMRVIVALQLALGDEIDDIPTWEQLRDRLVLRVKNLKTDIDMTTAANMSLSTQLIGLLSKSEAPQ